MTRDEIDSFCDLYDRIKREIKQKNQRFYERWKAGGYLVDGDVVSSYPIITEILDELVDELLIDKLTTKQLNRIEDNIVKHVNNIPFDREIDYATEYLSGLTIDDIQCVGDNKYHIKFSWENGDNILMYDDVTISAHFVGDVVEDITFLVDDPE